MKILLITILLTISLPVMANNYAIKDSEEIMCMTEAIFFEARNQPTIGQVAVAQVVKNRVASRRFPNTVCAVVNQRFQFSYKTEVDSLEYYDTKAFRKSLDVAQMVYFDQIPDILDGATMYHHISIRPRWNFNVLRKVSVIQDHVFYYHK